MKLSNQCQNITFLLQSGMCPGPQAFQGCFKVPALLLNHFTRIDKLLKGNKITTACVHIEHCHIFIRPHLFSPKKLNSQSSFINEICSRKHTLEKNGNILFLVLVLTLTHVSNWKFLLPGTTLKNLIFFIEHDHEKVQITHHWKQMGFNTTSIEEN